jgi:hypothetical protein
MEGVEEKEGGKEEGNLSSIKKLLKVKEVKK